MIKRYDIRFNDFKRTGMDIQLEDGKIFGEMSFLLDNKTANFKFSLTPGKQKNDITLQFVYRNLSFYIRYINVLISKLYATDVWSFLYAGRFYEDSRGPEA